MMLKNYTLLFISHFLLNIVNAQQLNQFNRTDSLRGSIGEGRKKWDVLHYNLTIHPDISSKTISGNNLITFFDSGVSIIQIDLQDPMMIDSIKDKENFYTYKKEGNVYWVDINPKKTDTKLIKKINIYFHGIPKIASNPPWDGGWIWKTDKNNNPWVTVACQGLGASCWYPCKDIQSDEPDYGATIQMIVPIDLMSVSNGRLISSTPISKNKMLYKWEVKSPINNYNIVPYIGKYSHFSDSYKGLNGSLDLDYWVLEDNVEKAKEPFKDVKKMLTAFEYWFGPYPFYQDGYKLVEAPHLGMEHQSAIAYGNKYMKGYLGQDLSGTGWGLNWDFIIIHESGHEWFGNNITANDIADMWIHEGFTNYSETLFTEYYYGKDAANEYNIGLRKTINNDLPIIGPMEVNKEGSGDMYNKGGNLIHTIRQIINNDKLFRKILQGINKDFYHQTVTSKQIESYISKESNFDFSIIFDQYLRTIKIPELEYYATPTCIKYRWTNTVDKFAMPIKIYTGVNKKAIWITPNNKWQTLNLGEIENSTQLIVDENFYVSSKKIKQIN